MRGYDNVQLVVAHFVQSFYIEASATAQTSESNSRCQGYNRDQQACTNDGREYGAGSGQSPGTCRGGAGGRGVLGIYTV